jgi:hypothetical protein
MTKGLFALGLACFLVVGMAIDSLLVACMAHGPTPLRWGPLIAAVVLCLVPALLNLVLALIHPWWRKRQNRGLRLRGQRTTASGIPFITLLGGAAVVYVSHGDFWSTLVVLAAFLVDPYGPVWGLIRQMRTNGARA